MLDSSPQGAPLDRYEVREYLSEGGMGAIYIGEKLGAGGFKKEVVLKQLLPDFTSQPEFIELFKREAQLSATLEHANIVKTIDLVTAGDDFFIVMEYVPGADLRTLLKRAKRRHRRVSPAAAIYTACEILSALAYAHNRDNSQGHPLNLIHRDVSPSNILVSHNGEVKLTDFGIAKASTHNSGFYRVKGKLGYMSPEQARSEQLDQRSDLYSLAVCLYETVTGERLFVVAGLTTSADEIYSQPVPLLSSKVSGVPAELDKVMLKALSVDPDHRYQTAGEFKEALLRCAHRHGLLMSAPELASHLREVCGTPKYWRNPDIAEDEQSSASAVAFGREGTEIIDDLEDAVSEYGTQELDVSGLEADDWISLAEDGPAASIVNDRERREQRAVTSLTNLNRLRGIELTSMFELTQGQTAALRSGYEQSPPPSQGRVRTPRPARSPEPPQELEIDFDSFADPSRPPQEGQHPLAEFESPLVSPPVMPSGPAQVQVEPRRSSDDRLQTIGRDDRGVASFEPGADPAPAPRRSRAWILLIVILLMGIAAAAVVGLSGPNLGGTEEGAAPEADTSSGPPQAPATSEGRTESPSSKKGSAESTPHRQGSAKSRGNRSVARPKAPKTNNKPSTDRSRPGPERTGDKSGARPKP
ncbi:MAG: protein kinase [Proteobacteria bacterium]|nr:protein kinase [Pseudomonadota bacterium]